VIYICGKRHKINDHLWFGVEEKRSMGMEVEATGFGHSVSGTVS
jgi:hypothetical protein